MPEAALTVTQEAVERFTERYLRFLGATISKTENRWSVAVPDNTAAELELDSQLTLVCGDSEDIDGEAKPLHPESAFFQSVLDDAHLKQPFGTMVITTDEAEIQLPGWLVNGDLVVEDASFTPFYDRTAIGVQFHVGIETVSEYQTEFLHVVAIDVRSTEALPRLAHTYLKLIDVERESLAPVSISPDIDSISDAVNQAQMELKNEIQPALNDVHENASSAADAELEDYRRFQEQRIVELEEEIDSISGRIEVLNQAIPNIVDRKERIDRLRERKDLRSNHDELKNELQALIKRRDNGYPERQQAIRKRHSLDVSIKPVGLTLIQYEKGELDLNLRFEAEERSLTLGYGLGTGVTEQVKCDECGQALDAANPADFSPEGIRGVSCCNGTR